MTFYHLYTIAGLVGALMLLHRLLRRQTCAHDWEPLVERELPAVAEVIDPKDVARWRSATLTYKAGRKKFFAVLGCRKCGETREFETMSGEDPGND